MSSNPQARHILILGYGEMGHAFESLLGADHHLAIWSRGREAQGLCQLEAEVTKAEIIIFCLPVIAHESVILRLKNAIKPGVICITIAKGLDEAGLAAYQILQRTLPAQPVAGIYGPMIAEEIIASHPGFAQLACTDDSIKKELGRCFQHSHLFLEPGSDLIGTSWSVILKNVYALLLGMSDGLGMGDNMRGFLMVKALQELSAIVKVMGGNANTPYDLAGLGDLVTTATSRSSHHHELGMAIGEGKDVRLGGEGVHSIKMVEKSRPFDYNSYPLFSLCVSVMQNTGQCREYFTVYLDGLKSRI